MTSVVRIGVVGRGFGARVVAPAFAATEGCEVVDVVSARDHEAVARLCARRDLDLVSAHAPPFLHATVVEQALAAGHAVLCDKPFGADAGDARRMVAAARDVGVALVNFEFRQDPVRRRLRDLVRGGALGAIDRVVWTHVSSSSRVPLRPFGWLFEREAGGGWIGAWGSHAVDALRWWLGDLVVESAVLRTAIAERPDETGRLRRCDAEDGFTAVLGTASGTSIVLDSTSAAPAAVAPRILVVGREAVVEVVADRSVRLRPVDGAREDWEPPAVAGDPHLAPMHAWAVVVRDAVRGGGVPPDAPTFADGLAVAEILDDIRATAR
ncbi:MAG: Gfo/Idh/MocA family protein [Acidimicrobiia bacterium]